MRHRHHGAAWVPYAQCEPRCCASGSGGGLSSACAIALALAALPCAAELMVDLATGEPRRAEVSLVNPVPGLYRTRSNPTVEWPRDVRCDHGGGPSISNGVAEVKPDCGVLRWRLYIEPFPANGTMASDQLAWSDAAWWLITERAGFLRNATDHPAPTVQSRRDGRALAPLAGPSRLPGLEAAPGFWLLGDAPHLDKGAIRHFFDGSGPPARLDSLLDLHAAAIGFLSNVLPGRALSPVFWLRLADWQAGIGGAAGTGLVIANYPVRGRAFDQVAEAITLYLILHEHGHQFLDGSGVLWIDESLASYLAVVAVREAAPRHYPVIVDAFVEPGRDPDVPLPLLGERAAEGDGTAYAQLYSGAAFWMALEEATPEPRGLLLQLGEVLAEGFDTDGRPLMEPLALRTGIPPRLLAEILDTHIASAPPPARKDRRRQNASAPRSRRVPPAIGRSRQATRLSR